MKKYVLFFGVVIGMCANLSAVSYESYRSSITAASQNGIILSTGIMYVRAVQILSTGAVDSTFALFDGQISSGTALKSYEGFSTTSLGEYFMGVHCSSGLIYSNLAPVGTVPARIRILWAIIEKIR